jgi:hypothetical protein
MKVQDVVHLMEIMENLLQKHEGKSFEDLQREIMEGLLQYKTYGEIAKDLNYDQEYVGTVSRKLYEVIAKELKDLGLGEKVKKSNFVTSLEKVAKSYQYNIIHDNKINFCPYNLQDCPQHINQELITNSCYRNLKFAPKIDKFCDRLSELEQLSQYISNDHIPLVGVLGFTGIGKSYLVKRFVDLNLDKFEIVIWQNLKFSQGLDEVINEVLSINNSDFYKKSELLKFFDILREKKCLIIFDSFEKLFIRGEFAGKYKPEFHNYQRFLKMLIEIEHQSKVILISQEKYLAMNQDNLSSVKCLELSGFKTTEIIKNNALKDEDCWLNLVELYEGNAIFLEEICLLIRDFYNGQVGFFLAEKALHFTPNMVEKINSLFERLSLQEKEIIDTLIKLNKPVNKEELKKYSNLTAEDLINSLNSLKSRFLLKQINDNYCLFSLIR